MLRFSALTISLLISNVYAANLNSDALNQKLSAQFSRFDSASREMLERSGRQAHPIERAEWESLLALPSDQAFTAQDLKELRSRQAQLIRQARAKASSVSAIDLDRVRHDGKVAEFCRRLPKGGMLHIHPWGSLDLATTQRILRKVNPKIPTTTWKTKLLAPQAPSRLDPNDLDFLSGTDESLAYNDLPAPKQRRFERLFFLPPGNHDFGRFLGVFSVISDTVFSRKEIDPEPDMYAALFARARDKGLRYLEISEDLRPYNAKTAEHLEARNRDALGKYGLTVRSLVAFNRMQDPVKTRATAEQLLKMTPTPAIVGINLVADEGAHPALEKGQGIYALITSAAVDDKSKLHRTMHAGELGDVRNVRDAILLGSERIGHSVKLREDPVTLEYARRRNLPVEANILSNERLLVVKAGEPHPFLDFLRLGLRVSLATDDEGIFETDINEECEAAVGRTDIVYAEMRRLVENSIATSFADPTTREELAVAVEKDLKDFEAGWAY